MDRRQFLAAAGAAALAGPLAARQGGDVESDFAALAEKAARQAAPLLAERLAAQAKVAVFPPGDADGRVTLHLSESARVLQGEMIYHLINLAQGKFIVLDKAMLARAFAESKTDPAGINRADVARTGELLGRLGLGAAIFGTIDTTAGRKSDLRPVKAALAVQFPDGKLTQLTGQVWPGAITAPRSVVRPRLRVELWLTGAGQPPRRLPVVADRRGGEQAGLLYAVLPRDLALGTPAAQYTIRLRNTGQGFVALGSAQRDPARERARLFTAAVSVDGVNSIYQDRGDGQIGPVMVHPRHARRWIVAGPGQLVVKHGARPADWHLEADPRGGPGHSVIDVPGFQRDAQTALSFTFAPAAESVAEAVGITSEVGVIAVQFFAQQLPGDEAGNNPKGAPIGTAAGAARRNVTTRLRVDTYSHSEAEYRIFYRPDDAVPIPPAQRIDPWAMS